MSKETIYADEISDIHYTGGMIRMDLGTYVTGEYQEDGSEPRIESNSQVVIPTSGFLESFNNMQEFVNKLLEAGILSAEQE